MCILRIRSSVVYKIRGKKTGYTVKYAVQPHIDPADRIQPDTGVAHACKVQALTGQRERQKKRPAGGPFMDVMSNSDFLWTEYRVLHYIKKKKSSNAT